MKTPKEQQRAPSRGDVWLHLLPRRGVLRRHDAAPGPGATSPRQV